MSHGLLLTFEVTILVLAIFLGFEVISKVPTLLHTPLMSGTNAIHGIVIVAALIVAGSSEQDGLIRVIGSGENHWPLIYDRDLADLYARVVAQPDASGIFHANDEADETVNTIVEGIVRHFSVAPEVRHVPLEEARKKMGIYADALALDQIVRSARARELGWAPTLHSVSANVPRLLEEFRRGQERAA